MLREAFVPASSQKNNNIIGNRFHAIIGLGLPSF